MRSIRSAGLGGRCDAGAAGGGGGGGQQARRRSGRAPAQPAGCTVSSTRSNTAKPTGLVSMRRSTGGPLRLVRLRQHCAGVGQIGFAVAGGQPAEHQQVVLRGVVVVRRQLVVQQVGDVQVHQRHAAQHLQRGLHRALFQLEFAPPAGDPDEALGGQHHRQAGRLAHRARAGCGRRAWGGPQPRSRRAASRAK